MHALSNNTAHNSNNAMAMNNAFKLKMNQRQIYPDLAAYSVYCLHLSAQEAYTSLTIKKR